MKRTTKNNLKAAGLVLGGSYLMGVAIFNILNAWFSEHLYYEFFIDSFARFSKWQLGIVMLGVLVIGYLLAATGVVYFWRKFKKSNIYKSITF